jgi:hypothetical protein|tara:strand:+ start:475 stop:978 length:504 start_codon:yes stop_codon:yes gene_type:complete
VRRWSPYFPINFDRIKKEVIITMIKSIKNNLDIALERVINPTSDSLLSEHKSQALVDACGIIPHFFNEACLALELRQNDSKTKLEFIADEMDSLYGFGGFGQYPWNGKLTTDGIYQSDDDQDEDMSPLVLWSYEKSIQMFVYHYGICAIRHTSSMVPEGECKIARFD